MKKKTVIILICGIAGALAACYGIGCVYYNSHFLPNTTINGISVAGRSAEDAESALTAPEDESFTVQEREDKSEAISLKDMDYKITLDDNAIADLLSAQKGYTWISALFNNDQLETTPKISYDKTKAETEIKNLNAFTSSAVKAPVNAEIQKKGNSYEIVKEEEGTTLDSDKTIAAVEAALNEGKLSVNLDEDGCYVEPEIKSDDLNLNNSLDLLKKVSSESITIDMGGGATEDLSGETLADLLELGADGNVAVNSDKLDAYVQGLADKYNTFNTKRTFTTSGGQSIEVGDQGNDTYGWLMDEDATKQVINDAILAEQDQTVDAMWTQTAFARNQANGDIGNTYIEVSISQQHLWYYKDGALVVESAVVTGNPNIDLSTPAGVYRVWAKQPNAVLRGNNLDGTKYENPVKYWMPFDWGGRGLHDASWRAESDFGGTIYTRSSWSHGCINLPTSVATTLFNTIDLNTPLVIYD